GSSAPPIATFVSTPTSMVGHGCPTRLAGLSPLHSRSLPCASYLALAAAWNRPRRGLIAVSRCSSTAPALEEDGMPATASSMGLPSHRTLTTRQLHSWP